MMLALKKPWRYAPCDANPEPGTRRTNRGRREHDEERTAAAWRTGQEREDRSILCLLFLVEKFKTWRLCLHNSDMCLYTN